MLKLVIKKILAILLIFILLVYILWNLLPKNIFDQKEVRIDPGMGLGEIAVVLKEADIIKSSFAFQFTAFMTLKANKLLPGKYIFKGSYSYFEILSALTNGGDKEVEVLIPEGSTIFDIDALLAKNNIIKAGDLIAYNENSKRSYEGFLFPDTYRFFEHSEVGIVVRKMTGVFEEKTSEIFSGVDEDDYKNLILASLLEKEVPKYEDRQIVAGILEKRMKNNWFLQVDASICYAKEPRPCYPLSAVDLKIDSRYNTYMFKGLPPTPIGNPGLEAIKAALSPKITKYWYYISDPDTKETIFASTLEGHVLNKNRYLQK